MENLKKLSDKQIFALCRKYGKNARSWSRRFGSLLPEVSKRKLFAKYGFYSIFEFAAKLCGMNRETVIEILRINEKLSDKPLLKAQMEEQGWSKLRVVANVATKETEKFWAEKVRVMPKKALELYVQEAKSVAETPNNIFNLDGKLSAKLNNIGSSKFLPGEESKWVQMSFKLDQNTEFRLRKFQQKLEKERRQAVPFNEVMKALLDSAEQFEKKDEKKMKSARKEREKIENQNEHEEHKEFNKPASRYIPATKKHEIFNGGRCSFVGCNKPHTEIHHPERFAIVHNHDKLAALCREHHILAHSLSPNATKEKIDQKFLKFLTPK